MLDYKKIFSQTLHQKSTHALIAVDGMEDLANSIERESASALHKGKITEKIYFEKINTAQLLRGYTLQFMSAFVALQTEYASLREDHLYITSALTHIHKTHMAKPIEMIAMEIMPTIDQRVELLVIVGSKKHTLTFDTIEAAEDRKELIFIKHILDLIKTFHYPTIIQTRMQLDSWSTVMDILSKESLSIAYKADYLMTDVSTFLLWIDPVDYKAVISQIQRLGQQMLDRRGGKIPEGERTFIEDVNAIKEQHATTSKHFNLPVTDLRDGNLVKSSDIAQKADPEFKNELKTQKENKKFFNRTT